jgi:tellurite methyltransferase
MLEDKQRWNQRFSDKALNFPKPPGFIEENASRLSSGCVLDIACGDGAAALYLAERGAEKGIEVVAADISDVALDRLNGFAAQKKVEVQTLCIDFDDTAALKTLGHFDAIVMAHYKPAISLLSVLIDQLKPDGFLAITTFNLQHHSENGFSKRFCLLQEEFLKIDERLSCEVYQSVERNGNYMDDYLFRKRFS